MKSLMMLIGIIQFVFLFASSFCHGSVVYQENFDDGVASSQTGPPQVCWGNNPYLPDSQNTPLCMSGRTLRTNTYSEDPFIMIDLRNCSGTSTLNFTYYQFANANVAVKRGTSTSVNCTTAPSLTTYTTIISTGSCNTLAVPLTSGSINYVMWDHPTGNSNALWIDFLNVDSTCSGGSSCLTSFQSNFGSMFQSGTICSIFPALWDQCEGNGPYITSASPCGGTGDYAMALGTGYPYSKARTVCISLSGASNPVLRYSYSWTGFASLSPIIEISTNDGTSWSTLVSSHANSGGQCLQNCVSLTSYIGQDIRLRFSSRSSSTSDSALFDDISVLPNDTPCQPTPTNTPTQTPTNTQTPTPIPTSTPTSTPTNTPTPIPTDTPTNTPTEIPTDTPTQIPTNTLTPIPTNTQTNTPTETPTDTPTDIPTDTPTNTPTEIPTDTPTPIPTNTPTNTPTEIPTDTPTQIPTNTPTNTPTEIPTDTPTPIPTNTPTNTPTEIPTDTPTPIPTNTPTNTPTETPTDTPTNTPTEIPTDTPTQIPTITPTPICMHTGDVNGDGVVSSGDSQVAFYISLGSYQSTYEEYCAADCDGNGIVSSGDAQLIFYYALGAGSGCSDPL